MLKWSMLRDIEHGSISEGDVIIGGLVAQASKLDVAAPVLKLTRECPENRGIMPRWLTACRWLPEPASKRREIFDGLKRRPV